MIQLVVLTIISLTLIGYAARIIVRDGAKWDDWTVGAIMAIMAVVGVSL